MQITVICDHCQKHYQVDSKLAGRKVKCKACGNAIAIPNPEPAPGDDLLAGLNAATESSLPLAPAPKPAAALVPPPLPVAPVPPAPVGAPRTFTSRPAAYAQPDERDSSGFRLNLPYENPFLNLIDTWIPKIAFWLLVAWIALLIFLPWIIRAINPEYSDPVGRMIGASFAKMILYTVFSSILLWMTARGIGFASRIMKFQLPEDETSRIVACLLFPSIAANLVMVLYIVVSSRAMIIMGGSIINQNQIIAMFLGMVVFLPIGFLTFWFFFRLKFLEALLGFPMMMIWFVLGIAANIALLALFILILGLFVGGIAKVLQS